MVTILLIFIYIFYIGLGIPDSLLGAAWPVIYTQFNVPVSYASYVSMIISGCTVISSLLSARIIAKLGTAKVTAISTGLTAVALLGFSGSQNFIWLCVFAIPLGIGAGSIDTALNNYVALHYNAMQMSFLHCFYGIGVTVSPYLMSVALSVSLDWRKGYRNVFFIQLAVTALSVVSLPLWKKIREAEREEEPVQVLTIRQMLSNKRILVSCVIFVGISALESICLIWGSTYLTNTVGLSADRAAAMITFYFAGMAIGRFMSGLLTMKFSDWQIIAAGQAIILLAVSLLLLQSGVAVAVLGLFLVGLGNGPMFPNITHLTPVIYGKAVSQSIIGLQMAFSYLSIMLTPVIFGILAEAAGVQVFPLFLLAAFVLLVGCTIILKVGESSGRNR